MSKKNTDRRKRILEHFAGFVKEYVTGEVAEAIKTGEVTPEEILAKVNLEIVRAAREPA
jgi:hypothetical protein